MHKTKLCIAILSVGLAGVVMAEGLSPEQKKMDQAMDQSYSDIANLQANIEYYHTQLDLQRLQQQLISLQGTETVSFKVLRIEGFDTIKVWLLGADGSVVEAAPGDVVFNDYRISQIKPSEVRVINILSKTLYTVPFAKQQDMLAASKATAEAKPIATVADKG